VYKRRNVEQIIQNSQPSHDCWVVSNWIISLGWTSTATAHSTVHTRPLMSSCRFRSIWMEEDYICIFRVIAVLEKLRIPMWDFGTYMRVHYLRVNVSDFCEFCNPPKQFSTRGCLNGHQNAKHPENCFFYCRWYRHGCTRRFVHPHLEWLHASQCVAMCPCEPVSGCCEVRVKNSSRALNLQIQPAAFSARGRW